MSRCFPYPPPGFIMIGNKACDEALIDSIKLQKVEKANKEKRKEKRKEKKGKSKEKKGLKKENKETATAKLTDLCHEASKDDKNLAECEGEKCHKRKYEEIEQLEGSSVTEEHGQPLNLQNPSYSSDSTQNCNKRRKQVSFADDSCGHGNIIRIKLPLQIPGSEVSKKQLSAKKSDVLTSKEQCCSTSGKREIPEQQSCFGSGWTPLNNYGQDVITSRAEPYMTPFMTNNSLHDLSPCHSNETSCPISANAEVSAQAPRQITRVSNPSPCTTSLDRKRLKRNSQYTNLIQNTYQMALPRELGYDDEEWLFGGKHSEKALDKNNVGKQFAVSGDVACSGSSMQFPCAHYLQEAKMFALPYTVPF